MDGIVGPRTASALKKYQESENLAAKLGMKEAGAEKRQSP